MDNENFTVPVPCKSYVKAFLENNCGTPANLKHLPDLYQTFIDCLANKPMHLESKEVAKWPDTVMVIIPSDVFYRYGWELNKTNLMDFNRAAALKVKFFMRQHIGINTAMGFPVAACIRDFQERFRFNEEVWPFDSIKKDFDRNGRKTGLRTIQELRKEINEIFLGNLSDLGTISKKFKKEFSYE
jgi:hypothetical protein